MQMEPAVACSSAVLNKLLLWTAAGEQQHKLFTNTFYSSEMRCHAQGRTNGLFGFMLLES